MILQGADGVEYLLVAVEASTLMDFLENEEGDWEVKTLDLRHLNFSSWLTLPEYRKTELHLNCIKLEPGLQAMHSLT